VKSHTTGNRRAALDRIARRGTARAAAARHDTTTRSVPRRHRPPHLHRWRRPSDCLLRARLRRHRALSHRQV